MIKSTDNVNAVQSELDDVIQCHADAEAVHTYLPEDETEIHNP